MKNAYTRFSVTTLLSTLRTKTQGKRVFSRIDDGNVVSEIRVYDLIIKKYFFQFGFFHLITK